jgi:hypothetical protein
LTSVVADFRASVLVDVPSTTPSPIIILSLPRRDTPLIVFMLLADTSVSCFVSISAWIGVDTGRLANVACFVDAH